MGEPQAIGYFRCARTGKRSPPIRCMDVLDSFPCLTCGAGLKGRNLRCRNPEQAEHDSALVIKWEHERTVPDPVKVARWAAWAASQEQPA